MRKFSRRWCAWVVVCGYIVGTVSAIQHNVAAMYANAAYMFVGTVCYCVIVKTSTPRR